MDRAAVCFREVIAEDDRIAGNGEPAGIFHIDRGPIGPRFGHFITVENETIGNGNIQISFIKTKYAGLIVAVDEPRK